MLDKLIELLNNSGQFPVALCLLAFISAIGLCVLATGLGRRKYPFDITDVI